MRTELMRAEVKRTLRRVPFQPFILTLESGERAVIEHPESMAFDPRPAGATDFYVLTGSLRLYSTFDAIAAITVLANGADDKTGEQVQA